MVSSPRILFEAAAIRAAKKTTEPGKAGSQTWGTDGPGGQPMIGLRNIENKIGVLMAQAPKKGDRCKRLRKTELAHRCSWHPKQKRPSQER